MMKLATKIGQSASVSGRPAPTRSLWSGRWLQSIGPVAILVVLSLAFQLASHNFLTGGNLAAIAEAAAVPVILATGLSFVIILGAIDLSLEGVRTTSIGMTGGFGESSPPSGAAWRLAPSMACSTPSCGCRPSS
jgi:ribose transport system permease protein